MKFNRLIISLVVLTKYMIELQNAGKNPAYTMDDMPGVVFMQYSEKGETFFTMISEDDYNKIKEDHWVGTNNYVGTCRGGRTVYLHRELCPNMAAGLYAHHRGSKFNHLPGMLRTVTPKNHDQHRTYCGDLVVDVDDSGDLVLNIR